MKAFALSMIALVFPFVLQAQDNAYKLNETYEMNMTGTITLNTDDADIKITGSNRSDVQLKVYRKVTAKGFVWGEKDFAIEVEKHNGNLDISEKSGSTSIGIVGYIHEEYTIDIEVPFGVSLDITGDDDDYIINNISGSIALDIDDGDAELRNCTGSEFKLSLDDGSIKMDNGKGRLYAKLDDGDIKINNASFSEIDASVDDGGIVIGTSLADNGRYLFRADDSDIVLNIMGGGGDFDIDHDDSHLYTSGGFETVEKEEDYTRLKLYNGTASVKIRVDDATLRLNTN